MLKKIAVFLFIFLFALPVLAGSRLVMDVDFNRPVWNELIQKEWGTGNYRVEEGALRLDHGVCLTTPSIRYRQGEDVFVSIDGRSKGIEAADTEWKVGRVTLVGFNTKGEECGHEDVMIIRGDQDYRQVKDWKYRFGKDVKSFRIRLSNEGKSGTVWYKNLRILLRDDTVEDLIGDPGFEGALGVDHWFFRKVEKDWDDLKTWETGSTATIDGDVPVAGKGCLKMQGPSTVVSKAFPYNGERLILSGWMRRKDVQGSGWQVVGCQFVGFDAHGKQVTHFDLDGLVNNNGSAGWTYYTMEEQFSSAVKTVQVWLRVFQGAKGTVWFDNYTLQRIPLKGKIPPYDAARAMVTVEAGKPLGLINHNTWTGTDTAYACWMQRGEAPDWLKLIKAAGFERIRMHEIHNAVKAYTRDDEKGNPVYDWSGFDHLFDRLVKQFGFMPVVTLETTPDGLDKPGSRTANYHNPDAPKDMVKWGKYIEAFLEHAVQRYGKEEVEKWYWEIWNEPGFPSGYYTGTPEEFADIAEQDYRAAERVEKKYGVDLKMGLTSGGGRYTDDIILNRLQAIGKLGQVDHYSFHLYSGWANSLRQFPGWAEGLREYPKQFPGLRTDCIKGNTEWNASSMNTEAHDNAWTPSLVVKYVRAMLDNGIDYGLFFAMVDHPELNPSPPTFAGYHGIITKTGVPKPVYNAFVFLKELKGGQRLPLTSSNDPIDGLAVVMPDKTVRIVLTSFDEDISRQPCRTEVTVKLTGLPEKKYRCTRLWAADERHGNSYAKWLELGKPGMDDKEAKKKMMEASRYGELPVQEVKQEGNGVTLTIAVPGPGIRFIELKPNK
jgi:xylan 1,4-beta-xylosidase